jgi:hypothetical protein
LGARRGDVFREVLADGMLPVLLGIVIGEVLSLGLTGLAASTLEGTAPVRLSAGLAVAAIWIAVAACACLLPAARAFPRRPTRRASSRMTDRRAYADSESQDRRHQARRCSRASGRRSTGVSDEGALGRDWVFIALRCLPQLTPDAKPSARLRERSLAELPTNDAQAAPKGQRDSDGRPL